MLITVMCASVLFFDLNSGFERVLVERVQHHRHLATHQRLGGRVDLDVGGVLGIRNRFCANDDVEHLQMPQLQRGGRGIRCKFLNPRSALSLI